MSASNRVLGFRKAYHRVIDPTAGMDKRMFCSTADDTTAIEPAYGQLPQFLPVVVGADRGISGLSLALARKLTLRAGRPHAHAQALQMATIDAAHAMKLESRAGSLDAGKQADVVIIDGNPLRQMRDNTPVRNAMYSATTDYAQPLSKGTLEAGPKTIFTRTANDIRWEKATEGQPWAPDLGKTNHFVYRENINAAYSTFVRTMRKVDVQLSLRAGQTNTLGTSLTTSQATARHYLNLFPSVAGQCNVSEKTRVGLSYSRKIDRFAFGMVNPFLIYLSPYSYAWGNPSAPLVLAQLSNSCTPTTTCSPPPSATVCTPMC